MWVFGYLGMVAYLGYWIVGGLIVAALVVGGLWELFKLMIRKIVKNKD